MGSTKLGLTSFLSLFFLVSCCFVVAFVCLLGCSLVNGGKFGNFGLLAVIGVFVIQLKSPISLKLGTNIGCGQ